MERREIKLVKIGEITPPTVPLRLREDFDEDALKFLRTCSIAHIYGDSPSPKKQKDFSLFKSCMRKYNGSALYELKPNVAPYGRLYSKGLQIAPRIGRALLCGGAYAELDFEACQAVIGFRLAEEKGWKCDALRHYVENRKAVLQQLMAASGETRDEMKEAVNAAMFGAEVATLLAKGVPRDSFIITQLVPELAALRAAIVKDTEYATLHAKMPAYLASKGKPMSDLPKSMAAFVLQSYERLALEAVVKELQVHGHEAMTYIHDGVLVRGADAPLPDDILRACEARVLADTGIPLKLASKRVEAPAALVAAFEASRGPARKKPRIFVDDGYLACKQKFETERSLAYIESRDVYLYRPRTSDYPQFVSKTHLNNIFDNVTYYDKDGEEVDFLCKWLSDPAAARWADAGFWPSTQTRAGVYNTFKGFAYQRIMQDADVPILDFDEPSVESIFWLCEQVCGGEAAATYFHKFLAFILQNPCDRTGIALVFQSDRKGVGKDTIVDWFAEAVLGREYFLSTSQPSRELFGNHNASLSGKLVCKIEEANRSMFIGGNMDQLKSLITAATLSINPKGKEQYKIDNYVNVMVTTNGAFAVPIEQDDRRFVIFAAKDHKHVQDREFFAAMRKALARPDVIKTMVSYWLNLDLTGFDLIRDRPVSRIYTVAMEESAPAYIRYLCELADHDCWDTEKLEPSEIPDKQLDGVVKVNMRGGLSSRIFISYASLFNSFAAWHKGEYGREWDGATRFNRLIKANSDIYGPSGEKAVVDCTTNGLQTGKSARGWAFDFPALRTALAVKAQPQQSAPFRAVSEPAPSAAVDMSANVE